MKKFLQILKVTSGTFIFILILSLTIPVFGCEAEAAGIKMPDEFAHLSGDGKYIYDGFYRLDTEKLDMLDLNSKFGNLLTNILLGLVMGISKVTVMIFYWCMSFDLGNILAEPLAAIQEGLRISVFVPLLYVALVMMVIKMLNNLWRRNFVGIMGNAVSVIAVIILSVFFVNESGKILSAATSLSKVVALNGMISVNSATGITEEGGHFDEVADGMAYQEKYAREAAGVLWVNMFHEPWKELEFGNNYDAELSEKLMSERDEEAREEIIKEAGERECFKKEVIVERLAALVVYLIPLLIKSAVYIAISAIQLFFQLMSAVFVLLAMVVLIIELFPGYGIVLETWARKMLEYQICIIVVTILMAILVWVDNIMFQFAGRWGWMIVCVFQVIMAVSLYFGRQQIFGLFQKIQRAVQTPAYARAMIRNSGSLQNTQKSFKTIKNGVLKTGDRGMKIGKGAMKIGKEAVNTWIKTGFKSDSAEANEQDKEESRPSLQENIRNKREGKRPSIKTTNNGMADREVRPAVRPVTTATKRVKQSENTVKSQNISRPKSKVSEEVTKQGIRENSLREVGSHIEERIVSNNPSVEHSDRPQIQKTEEKTLLVNSGVKQPGIKKSISDSQKNAEATKPIRKIHTNKPNMAQPQRVLSATPAVVVRERAKKPVTRKNIAIIKQANERGQNNGRAAGGSIK